MARNEVTRELEREVYWARETVTELLNHEVTWPDYLESAGDNFLEALNKWLCDSRRIPDAQRETYLNLLDQLRGI